MYCPARTILTALALVTGAGSQGLAQTAASSNNIRTGMMVTDTDGNNVGLVTAVSADYLTVKTDRHDARLPRTSFTPDQGKLLFGMTQQQLDAAVERSQAAAEAQLMPGVLVKGSQGAVVGTIDSIDDQFATLKLTSGKLVKISRTGLGAGAQGAVIGITADAIERPLKAVPQADQ